MVDDRALAERAGLSLAAWLRHAYLPDPPCCLCPVSTDGQWVALAPSCPEHGRPGQPWRIVNLARPRSYSYMSKDDALQIRAYGQGPWETYPPGSDPMDLATVQALPPGLRGKAVHAVNLYAVHTYDEQGGTDSTGRADKIAQAVGVEIRTH